MDAPCIEPEVSITKIDLTRAGASAVGAVGAGGSTIRSAKTSPPRSFGERTAAAATAAPRLPHELEVPIGRHLAAGAGSIRYDVVAERRRLDLMVGRLEPAQRDTRGELDAEADGVE